MDVTFGSLESTEDEERAARAAIYILFTNFLAACWVRTTSRSHAYRDTESTVYTLSSDEYHDVRRSPAMLRIRSVVCVYAAGAYTHPGAYTRAGAFTRAVGVYTQRVRIHTRVRIRGWVRLREWWVRVRSGCLYGSDKLVPATAPFN